MISGKQVRAARGLLGWSATDLAEQAGCKRLAIEQFERGETNPQKSTLSEILKALYDAGIEFLDNEGVRFRPEGMDILNGQEGLAAFFDEVFKTLSLQGGSVCVAGVDEMQFAKHHGKEHAEKHIRRMTELTDQKKDIQFRVLIQDGDNNFLATDYCHYKWQSKDNFVSTPFYVYGDNLALITFQVRPAPKIMIIRSEAFANAYRKQFEIAWMVAKEPLKKTGKRQNEF